MRKARESFMALSCVRRGRVSGLLRALVLGSIAILAPRPAVAADIVILLDQAKLVKMPDRVATIVIGNPLIADASVQTGGLMVLTGKGYGTTNIIALDRAGAVLLEKTVEVQGPRNVMVVYRGINRETWVCAPRCEKRITLGDGTDYFDAVLGQTVTRSGAALGLNPSETK
jgi:Pilus formation protein N terminal region